MVPDGFTPGRKQRWACRDGGADRKYCYTTTDPKGKSVRKQDGSNKRPRKVPVFKRTIGEGKTTLLITAAQNGTPVHKLALKAAEQFCNARNAELLVVPIRYKNPTSRWTKSQENAEVWDAALTPYLVNQRMRLNKNLTLLGDIKTQPTAVSPLTGFEALTHADSGILAHTKLEMKTIATPQHRYPKILTTTGAITKKNYSDTPTGKRGDFHHFYGATIVEIEGNKFHLRQAGFDKKDGSFYDLDTIYGANWSIGPWAAGPLAALNMGDSHVRFMDPQVYGATFGKGGIIPTLRPGVVFWNDLFDGISCNPHHRKAQDPFIAAALHRAGYLNVEAEVNQAIEFLLAETKGFKSVVVESNHNDFLRRWVVSGVGKNDPANAGFYHKLAGVMYAGAKMEPWGAWYPDPFIWCVQQAAEKAGRDDIQCLQADESYDVLGIENGMHGHYGPNGARGSRKNLRRIGTKSIIGHGHSPGIDEGCWQTGTSTFRRAEYTHGPSSWLQSHVGIYKSGKRVLLNIINGQWRRES